jgi:dTDP-4-dehydrorhamnose 3,5-epimerase
MNFRDGPIDGIIWKPLSLFRDKRGWLCELFRDDELPEIYHPTMCYISMTEPGIARGPHEHVDQADYFCFLGPSDFKVYLWDARPGSPTLGHREIKVVGESSPHGLVVPAGVVHAYKNVGTSQGIVFNAPNRLYKGWGKKDPVDEIRHEEQAGSLYHLE